MRILITGVLGFIGSHFLKYTLTHYSDMSVTGVARLSSQKSLLRIKECLDNSKFTLVYGDLAEDISGLLENVDIVFNFAAKTFVDHSIKDPLPFMRSNIIGTYNLLEQARYYKTPLFVQISTDEVYGSILKGAYKENACLNPTNPYSSTKAAADMLVIAYGNTYHMPFIITRTENNYGKYQHPQKVFPVFVKYALTNKKLPVYGDGKHKRMWIRVEDHCSAIWHLVNKQARGIYHVAGEQELENIELARIILKTLNLSEDMIEFIPDFDIRPGHDRRYALNVDKLKNLGWKPQYTIDTGIPEIINWYRDNLWWLE